MIRRTWTLGFALALGAACTFAPMNTARAGDEDPVADWDKRFARVLDQARDEYVKKLAKWCDKNDLAWTANYVRRRAFLYDPNDSEMREHFGYEKGPDGRWVQNDIRKTELRTTVDEDDPNATKYPSNILKAEKKIAKWFVSVARKASKMSEEAAALTKKSENPGEYAAQAEAFSKRAEKAWHRVLEARPDDKTAHKALNHPKFDGEYVSPYKLGFVKARKARRQTGERIAAKPFEVEAVPADGLIVEAGISAVGSKTEHWIINASHKQEVSDRLAVWAERALEDMVEIYGLPEESVDRKGLRKLTSLKAGKDEIKQFLVKGVKRDEKEVAKWLDYGFGGTTVGESFDEQVSATGPDRGGDDFVVHYAAHAMIRGLSRMALSDLGVRLGYNPRGVEVWLRESISYDVTSRLTGTKLSSCATIGKYGRNIASKPGQDLWLILARRQVEMDDDVPLSALWQKGLNELLGPESVKGFALLQFLFERDAATAQKFVWHSMAHGTPAAVLDVYGEWLGVEPPSADEADTATTGKAIFSAPAYQEAMNRLDDHYRKWIIKTHD